MKQIIKPRRVIKITKNKTSKSQDKKGKKNINTKSVIKIATITFCTLAVILLLTILTTKVDIETEGWCNSGYIELDRQAYNYIQNKIKSILEKKRISANFR